MTEFAFTELLTLGPDPTSYRKLAIEGVGTVEAAGRTFLTVPPGVLTALAAEAMHDIAHFLRPGHLAQLRRILDDPEAYRDAVRADQAEAAALGATGVPFFVVDEKYGVSGAQPTELFAEVLEKAWGEKRPAITTISGAENAEACGPDGCPV